MALRNAPHILGYAREMENRAPQAWLINFTNPVGIITQVVQADTQMRVIGICDTPTELFAKTARALGVELSQCHFDYFGLNHLGWLREVYYRGEPLLHRLWNNPQALSRIYRVPLFEPEFLSSLRLLPTEYLFYYYRSREAFENTRKAGQTRGQVIERLNKRLFQDLERVDANPVEVYRTYIADREACYLHIESGSFSQTVGLHDPTTGYHQIALAVVRAIHFNTGTVIPLNVPNQGNLSFLQDRDVVEVPCVVNVNGPKPLHLKPVPENVSKLITQVKDYERLTVKAVLARSRDIAVQALCRHPLVENASLARDLYSALETR
jgi:6-phospho-beta-glucosidase